MATCIALISSARLVSSSDPSKRASQTSQNQTSSASQSTKTTTKPNITGTAGNAKSPGNQSQSFGSGTQVKTSNGQPKDTKPKPGSASASQTTNQTNNQSKSTGSNQSRSISGDSKINQSPKPSTGRSGGSGGSTPAKPAGTATSKTPSTPSADQDSSISQTTPAKPAESLNLVVLDISKKDSCDEYFYSKDNSTKTETYTAKPSYKFKQVKNGNTIVWDSRNNKYHTKVILTTDDQGKENINLCDIGPNEHDTPLTIKPRENSSLSTSSLDQDLKVVTLDPSYNTKTKENDTSQYELEDADNFLTYKFKKDAKCTEVKHKENSLWKYDHIRHGTYPDSIYFMFGNVLVFPKGEESEDTKPQNLVQLDIESSASSNQYDYSENKQALTRTYTPKKDYGFNKVFKKKGGFFSRNTEQVVWKAENEKEYAVKVEFNYSSKVVAITMNDERLLKRDAK